jgi:hypothetical protein
MDVGSDDAQCAWPVPIGVMEALTEDGHADLTDDPATDLIRAESRWRLRSAQLEDTTAQLYTVAVAEFADLHTLPPTPREVTDRLIEQALDPSQPPTLLRTALDQFVASCRYLSAAQDRVRAVRGFVIGLALPGVDAPAGLLAGVRSGWRRDPAMPRHVAAYASEDVFVAANPRRGFTRPARANRDWLMAPDDGPVAGEVFGVSWRRDGDDDDTYTDEPAVLGPWQLGYIPATGEIYATRHCHYRDPQVWLLARGYTNPEWTRRVLSNLKRRMGEPNSLLLAARVLRTAAAHEPPTAGQHRGHRHGHGVGGSATRDVHGGTAGSGWD